MNKAYSRINWENYPSDATPMNNTNLNKMDAAVDEIDDRVITMDTTKLSKTDAATMIANVSFDEDTGKFTFTRKNGATVTIDTKLEKIAVNWTYDSSAQQLILTLDDGTMQKVDLSALITQTEFVDSATVDFSLNSAGKVIAVVKDGSITEEKLEPNYLANIKVEAAKAETSANSAEDSAVMAKSYAVGDTGTRTEEAVDNSKYYYEQSKRISQGVSGLIPMGTITFAELAVENNQVAKFMFNISEDFATDDTFKEGAGFKYPAGTNVYRTSDGYWDCLAGAFLALNGDSKDNTTSFTSADTASPTAWTNVDALKSGEKHSSIFNKVSKMFKNVRYLYKLLGTTDISAIGDGTATGAIAILNTNLTKNNFAFSKVEKSGLTKEIEESVRFIDTDLTPTDYVSDDSFAAQANGVKIKKTCYVLIHMSIVVNLTGRFNPGIRLYKSADDYADNVHGKYVNGLEQVDYIYITRVAEGTVIRPISYGSDGGTISSVSLKVVKLYG